MTKNYTENHMKKLDLEKIAEQMTTLFKKVAKNIMDIYDLKPTIIWKDDNSPATNADILAEKQIFNALKIITPNIAVIGEETSPKPNIDNHKTFWLIDPIDGTRAFIAKKNLFTINAGLIHNKKPAFGIIYCPLTDEMYVGYGKNAFKNNRPIQTRPLDKQRLVVANNKSTLNYKKTREFFLNYKIEKFLNLTSSIKICYVAEGAADIYPRFGRTCEWDIAAGHAILNAAGGNITTTENDEMTYGKKDFFNPHFICTGKRT